MEALRTFKKTICACAIVLAATLGLATTPILAGSGDFAGIYIGVRASVNGAGLDGTYSAAGNGAEDDEIEVNRGKAGAFVPAAGLEAGVNLPLGDVFFVTAGASWISGSADLGQADDFGDAADVVLEISDHVQYFIAPSVSIFDNSAIYIKYGRALADLTAIGDVTGQPNNLQGTTYGIGVSTISNSGIFLKTEAGATQYDQFKLTGIGGSDSSILEADPLIAYGAVSIGFKF